MDVPSRLPLVERRATLRRASTSKGPDDTRGAAPALAGGPHGAARGRAQGNAPRVGRVGRGGRPGRRGARVTRIPPGRCGSPASHTSEPRGAERSAVKGARVTLRFPVAGCMFALGTGAARAGSATSGQSPLRGITRAPKSCRQRPEPCEPRWGGMTWCGRSQGWSKRSVCLHGGPLRGRPRRTALPFFRGQDRVVAPSSRPVMSVTFPIRKSLLTFVCPALLHLPANPSRSGSALGVDEFGGGVQGDTVSIGLSFWRR